MSPVAAYSTTASAYNEVLFLEPAGQCQSIDVCGPSCESFSSFQFPYVGRIAEGWSLRQPLLISVEKDTDGTFIASELLFSVYGAGATPEEALQDFVGSLIDYYELIAERSVRDDDTHSLFRRLEQYLQPEETV